MRFVLIYRNDDNLRQRIEGYVSQLILQGVNFEIQPADLPMCKIRTSWPNQNEANSVPFNVQCEEVEWDGKNLISIRKLIIDIEIITEKIEREIMYYI